MTRYIELREGQAFEVNEELAGIVPMANMAEQAALTEDIRENGLREPVILWRNKIVDGRCRQKACLATGVRIKAKELDDDLTEEDVMVVVKSLNTRRNLSPTQKLISACKETFNPKNKAKSIIGLAKAWSVSHTLLKNARYIYTERNEFIEPLFQGGCVTIIGSNGKETQTNKISAIYAYIKREEENANRNDEHGWNPDAQIKTQAGKEWYYQTLKTEGKELSVFMRMTLAELANFKFTK